jgi:hypothetical protein
MTFQMLLAATALSWIASLFSKGLPLWVPIGFVSIFGVLYVNPALNRPVIASVLITSAPMALIARYSGIKKCERVAFICSGVLALLCWLTTEIAPYNNYVQRTISEAGTAGLEWRRQGPREVYEIIDKSLQDLPVTGTPIVWCSEHGWMDGRTVAWEAVKRGKRWMVFTETELSKPSHAVYPKYSDYIVIAGPEIMGSIKTPDSTTSIDVKALLQTDKNLQCVGEVNDPAGGTIAVLKNLDSHKNQNPEQACPDWLEAKIKRLSRIN